MLCSLAESQIQNFLLESSRLMLRSTARFIGEMDELFIADLDKGIAEGRVVRDGEIGRQSPRGGGPDNDRDARPPDNRELYINTLADVVFVFDFRLGQRGAAWDAPIDRFLAAIDKTLCHDIREKPEFVRFIFLVQRQVGIEPITQATQTDELSAL